MEFLKKLGKFLKDVAQDERIPDRDKAVLTAMLALIVSPVDIIPDWIPVIGVMDDMVLAAIILDYICNVLDDEVLLRHYPWGMKSYVRIKKGARIIAALTPSVIKNRIWQYQPDPYRKT